MHSSSHWKFWTLLVSNSRSDRLRRWIARISKPSPRPYSHNSLLCSQTFLRTIPWTWRHLTLGLQVAKIAQPVARQSSTTKALKTRMRSQKRRRKRKVLKPKALRRPPLTPLRKQLEFKMVPRVARLSSPLNLNNLSLTILVKSMRTQMPSRVARWSLMRIAALRKSRPRSLSPREEQLVPTLEPLLLSYRSQLQRSSSKWQLLRRKHLHLTALNQQEVVVVPERPPKKTLPWPVTITSRTRRKMRAQNQRRKSSRNPRASQVDQAKL